MKSVLVVDDGEAERFIAECIINTYNPNIDISFACDGQEALAYLEEAESEPDVIFLDLNMPRMSGHEFIEEYCSPHRETAKIVVLTSSVNNKDKERCLKHKCVKAYVNKPLEQSILDVISSH